MQDLIIIGGGAAGLAAATYALGKQLDFKLIANAPGKAGWRQEIAGQHYDEQLPGSELVAQLQRTLAARPGHTLVDSVLGVEHVPGGYSVTTVNHGVFSCQALVIASGATPRTLDVPGAAELLGHGLGYSVTTHAQLLSGKTIAVIGITPRTLRGVAEIAPNAEKIYLIAPETLPQNLPPEWSLDANVELLAGYSVREVIGPRHVSELVLARGDTRLNIGVDAAFVDVGLRGNSQFVERLVAVDHEGFILVDNRNATSAAGVFAAGDVTSAFGEQVLIAIGEGARAALSAYDYLLARRERRVRAPVPPAMPPASVTDAEAANQPQD